MVKTKSSQIYECGICQKEYNIGEILTSQQIKKELIRDLKLYDECLVHSFFYKLESYPNGCPLCLFETTQKNERESYFNQMKGGV